MARNRSHIPIDKQVEIRERRARFLQMRLAGKTQAQIAAETGFSKQVVSTDIRTALADITRESAEEYVEMINQRYDAMLAGIYEDATHGDNWKIDRALAIEDQRAKLLGLYKHAELKVVADAKGNVGEESKSMVGQLVNVLHALHGQIQDETDDQDDAGDEADEE